MTENSFKKIGKYSFSLQSELGQCSYGDIYKGKNDQTGAPLAVKILNKIAIQNHEYLQ